MDVVDSVELTEQRDNLAAKQTAPVAWVSDDLKCGRAWEVCDNKSRTSHSWSLVERGVWKEAIANHLHSKYGWLDHSQSHIGTIASATLQTIWDIGWRTYGLSGILNWSELIEIRPTVPLISTKTIAHNSQLPILLPSKIASFWRQAYILRAVLLTYGKKKVNI